MSPRFIGVTSAFIILTAVAAILYLKGGIQPAQKGEEFIHVKVKEDASKVKEAQDDAVNELNELATRISSEMRTEMRLNLNMVAQLRSYHKMIKQIQGYAKKVEKDIDFIKDITKDEFQEDVVLQASLFSGKKPDMVAKHLEEFRPSRVGAILAKMKGKEASAVMDVWARNKDPRVSAFYRQIMASYLTNKRRDNDPVLFNQVNSSRRNLQPQQQEG
jgi:hypothetical protein